uniref:Uncharacterized protein n=1 Tax=Tanacetum cinerariifolium TaxID=118510 RepID=A0A699HYN7_TANCI|nr:hypothetical protein [Tanacetum cinerariifolium]
MVMLKQVGDLSFYMYPRFLQLMIRKQVGDLSTYTTKYTSPALTQKVFANMRRVGKGFFGVETPLFEGMLVEQQVVEEGDADGNDETVNAGDAAEGDVSAAHGEIITVVEEPSIPSPTPPTPPPQPSQDILSTSQVQPAPPRSPQKLERRNKVRVLKLRRLQKVKTSQRVETSDETVMDDKSNQGRMIAEMDQDADVVLEDDREVADDVKDVEDAKIITEVVTAASKTITAASTNITAAEAQAPAATLTAAPARVVDAPSRRRKGVIIRDLQEESNTSIIILAETKSKDKELHAELNKNTDWDEVIDHVKIKAKKDPAVKKYQALKRKPQTEAQARKNLMLYLKNVAGFKMDYFKGMPYDDIRPIFEAKFNSNVAFLLKTKVQIEEDENRALQRVNETPAERAAKRQKLNEKVEELKRYLQIVPNEDDDVYTEATPLDQKVPVVDYQIIELNNKPYYKIIRADDTHQLYVKNKQEKDKIGTKSDKKREAWRSPKKSKAVSVNKARKTEQNTKRMAENANTVKSYSKFKGMKKRKGL